MNKYLLALAWAWLFFAGAVGAQEEGRKMAIFDIAFCTQARPDYPGPDLARLKLVSENKPPMMDDEKEVPSAHLLVRLIRANIAPDSWLNSLHSIVPRDGKLFVVQTPMAIKAVRRFLDILRASHPGPLSVRAWALSVEKTFLEAFLSRSLARAEGSLLSNEDLDRLLSRADPGAVTILSTVSVTCFSGQRVHVGPLNRRRYIRDLDVEVSSGIGIIDPIMGTLLTGFLLDVRPSIVGPHGSVLLDLRLGLAEYANAGAFVDAGIGRIDTPRRTLLTGATTVLVPRDKAVFFSASHPETPGRAVLFVVKPTVKGWKKAKKEEKKAPGSRRVLRTYDVGLLTSRLDDYPGLSLDINRGCTTYTDITIMEDIEEDMGGENLVQLIETSIEPESWDDVRNSITRVGPTLVVVQKPLVHEKIAGMLETLWDRRAVLVFARLRFIDADRATLARIAGTGTSALDAKAARALEKELRGPALTLLRSASITCFNGQRVHFQTISQRAVIGDVDVAVAAKAGIGDPIMVEASEGLVFDFTPVLCGDGRHLTVTLRPQIASMTTPVTTRISDLLPNTLQKYTLSLNTLLTTLTMPDRGTVFFITGTSPGDRVKIVTLTLSTIRVK
jgi:hypothetical protein